ncbi:acyl-CoA dehydrogenase family protein [Corynebacterium halotolerans]|uniref:Acyl-CoA dehydrogenase n=1 Tax=Corynebacterium halotolerans YIM 70093 = DSM 44683 TaxID=1121362 RepID=M1NPC7_9CORY|nr:acyl-CoA dehydrogenase family protein [Corynebacterium halotolerans]AGF73238.1 hypothetical protein A605_11190 [Corynebacterium halotolerans YIM 70093 = DSM 44683]
MSTTAVSPTTPALILDPELRASIAENAKAVDKGEKDARYALSLLGEAGLLGRDLLDTARLIRELSAEDLSVGFTVWADRVTLSYLEAAGTGYALELAEALRVGRRPGVSGMAGPFKEFAGCGEIDLHAEKTDDGYVINGKLNWASNLYDDAVVVSGAKTDGGERFLFVLEAGHKGVHFGRPFGLLGLNATASAWVTFEDVHLPAAQVLTGDFESFMAQARPTFSLLQISECIGVAEASAAAAGTRLSGVNETFTGDVERAVATNAELVERQEAIIARLGQGEKVSPVELLELRLDAAEAAVAAANVEVRVAGGAGYAKNSPASRRFREAAFIPVQSPSEAQLRWELARARENADN